MQNGLDHESHKAPEGARPATRDETVIDNWTLDQLTDFCDQNGIDYPIGASRDDLMDAIMASGVPYPVDAITAEEITEPGEVAKQLLLAQMELIVHATEIASKGRGNGDAWNYVSDQFIGKDAPKQPKDHPDTAASAPAPLYRVICALSDSMATCVNAYAALEQSLQKTSTAGTLERIAEKVLPMLGA